MTFTDFYRVFGYDFDGTVTGVGDAGGLSWHEFEGFGDAATRGR